MGCIVGRANVAVHDDSSANQAAEGSLNSAHPTHRTFRSCCCCFGDPCRALKRIKDRFTRMHENLHQATSREFDLGFAEIQAPDAVKRLAKKHARFLVSLHYLKLTSQSGMSKIEANAQDEAHIPQLEERSWPMYFVDNIRIRKICDVSRPTARSS